ncbi:MAG: TolC family protein [Cyclobacteriaceae bacterium]|nr:TolC family protein [Cyclobacteriaceae bacterium]
MSKPVCAQQDFITLSYAEFMSIVMRHHPVSRQADLFMSEGERVLQASRGAFDPYIYAGFDNKFFESKEYFSLFEGGLKVPTWYGVELKAGFERNQGLYLNPEHFLPDDGLTFAGISVPVGQGLFMDQRRASLMMAKAFKEETIAGRMAILNDLLVDAAAVYWNWYMSYQVVDIYREAVDLAMERFEGLVSSFEQGDIPAIDTLEAYLLVQTREITLNESSIKYQKASMELSNFIWSESGEPYEITERVIPKIIVINPEDISLDSISAITKDFITDHPEIVQINYQLEQLEIDRRLKVELLKPRLNLNYNFLVHGNFIPNGGEFQGLYANNYKWGVEFSMPILFRRGRGSLQLAKIKIESTEQKQKFKTREIHNKIEQYLYELSILENQLEINEQAVQNHRALLLGEQRKFEFGESSIFLINTRESNLLSAQVKFAELAAMYKTSFAALFWSLGILPTDISE